MSEYIPITPEQFRSLDGPAPPRIMSKEGEHMTAVLKEDGDASRAIVGEVQRLFDGSPSMFGESEGEFQRDGGRTYNDCGNIERAGPECLGPRQQACSEIAGQMMIMAAARSAVGSMQAVYRRAGGYGRNGLRSTGFHENLLTPSYPEKEEQMHDAQVFGAYLATRVIWSGSGLVMHRGYSLSQKAHDIKVGYDDGKKEGFEADILGIGTYGNRTQERCKPMLAWSRKGGGFMESHSGDGWERLEVRYADSTHSPWVRQMSMATASLTLRLLEHKPLFSDDMWKDLKLSKLAKSVSVISNDMTFNQKLSLRSGEHATALEIQMQFADMAWELSQSIELPNDEVWAIYEWRRVCEDLKQFDSRNYDSVEAVRDRLEWAARLWAIQERNKKIGNLSVDLANMTAVSTDLIWDRIHPHSPAEKYWRINQADFYTKHDDEINHLMNHPPRYTRAYARGQALQRGFRVPGGQWNKVQAPDEEIVHLPDPYNHTF